MFYEAMDELGFDDPVEYMDYLNEKDSHLENDDADSFYVEYYGRW